MSRSCVGGSSDLKRTLNSKRTLVLVTNEDAVKCGLSAPVRMERYVTEEIPQGAIMGSENSLFYADIV